MSLSGTIALWTVYKVTAAIVDTDGVTQALLRGDGASMVSLGAAPDKAYTVLMVDNADTSGTVAQHMGASPSAGGVAKLPRIVLLGGAIRIKVGSETIGAIAVGGAPAVVRRASITTRLAPKPVSTRSAGD